MNEDILADIIVELLEVFINHILYIREIYPAQIFRQRKIYNCPVFVSIYPNLTNYITEVLTTARALKKANKLQKVEIIIYRDDRCSYEKYAFDVSQNCNSRAARRGSEDEYLLEFEQQIRTALYTLSERCKPFEKLPRDAKFKLQLHTTQAEFLKTCCGPMSQNFPWLQVGNTTDNFFSEVKLLPLCSIDSTGIKITALF